MFSSWLFLVRPVNPHRVTNRQRMHGHVHMCVCVCVRVRLSLVYQPTFSGWMRACQGRAGSSSQLLAGGQAQLTPPSLRKPPFHCCSQATSLSVRPAPCTGPDFNYTLSVEFTGGFLGGGGTFHRPPAAHFPSVD